MNVPSFQSQFHLIIASLAYLCAWECNAVTINILAQILTTLNAFKITGVTEHVSTNTGLKFFSNAFLTFASQNFCQVYEMCIYRFF